MSCWDADRFDGLQGVFVEFWDGQSPDDKPMPDRGEEVGVSCSDTRNNRSKRDEDTMWFDHEHTSYGDYHPNGTVGKSNFRVLLERAQELDADPNEVPDECRPWFAVQYCGYGGHAILFHVERTPDEIVEMLAGLSDYPLINDDDHSELESELEQEAWEDTYREDYRRALVKVAERVLAPHYVNADVEVDLDDVTDEALDKNFYENAEAISEYWEHSSEGAYIDVDKVAEYALSNGEAEELPEGYKITGRRKTPGDRMMDFFFNKPKDPGMNGLMDLPSWRPRRRRRR